MDDRKLKFLGALNASCGIIADACAAVNVGRTTFYRWYNSDKDFKEQVDIITETQVDYVESKLLQKITAGDTTAIIFYLKTKGKARGYTEKAKPKEEKQIPTASALLGPAVVETADSAESKKRIERKVKSKKAYITKLLKKQGKYTAELTYQVEITAQLLVRADMLGDEILADGHKSINVEYSREGNERITVNPKEKLYLEVLEKGQKALRALGMNTESKDRKSGGDSYGEFLKAMNEGEEDGE